MHSNGSFTIGSSVSGYQVAIAEDNKFTKNSKTINVKSSNITKTIKKLSKNKKYYIKIRAYKSVTVDGKKTKMFSKYSKTYTVNSK